MKLKKFMKMGSFSSKIAKFDAQRSLRAGLLLTSLETRCGAHPSSLRTSAIQTIFNVPSICIIMRIISENDDRTTRFACVRPSTVSTTRKTPIVRMALRHHRRAAGNHKALTSWHYTHACVGPNTSHSAHQRAIAPHITWMCSFAGPWPHEK